MSKHCGRGDSGGDFGDLIPASIIGPLALLFGFLFLLSQCAQ